jgi:phenylacetate-CoA ligase
VRPLKDEKYYILDMHVIVEIEQNELEEGYDVIVTDLDNFGMPKLRYKIGDMIDGIYEPNPNSKYQLSYFKKIIGRNSDIITLPNGMKFHPVNIFGGTTFRQFKEITRHKVIWDGTLLEILLEAKDTNNKVKIDLIIGELLSRYEVNYKVNYTDKIPPSKSGKYKYLEIKTNK